MSLDDSARIIGIDPGTAQIGAVVIKDNSILYQGTWVPSVKETERIVWYRDELHKLILQCKVTDGVIEGYSYMSKWRAHDLGEVGGVIRVLFYDLKIPLMVVPPPTLKKFVSGKGNCQKDFMMLFAFRKWGKEFSDTHQCDAYCLARYLQEKGREKELE